MKTLKVTYSDKARHGTILIPKSEGIKPGIKIVQRSALINLGKILIMKAKVVDNIDMALINVKDCLDLALYLDNDIIEVYSLGEYIKHNIITLKTNIFGKGK